jgi:hypothetical protein
VLCRAEPAAMADDAQKPSYQNFRLTDRRRESGGGGGGPVRGKIRQGGRGNLCAEITASLIAL